MFCQLLSCLVFLWRPQVAAGSLVLKPVPPHTLVAGSPAKEIGVVAGNPALDMEQWNRKVGWWRRVFRVLGWLVVGGE